MTQRDQYTKTIATVRAAAIDTETYDKQPVVHIDITHCDKPPLKLMLRVGDSIEISYSPEIESPDGRSLVRAAWAVLFDILGFKKVEAR